ncbi:MAG: flavodoxin family protein [Treponema sp.]|nr:flavodoxin family protein [Treponema sp.]
MNVLMINGSPHEKGCTYVALNEVANELKKSDIDSTIFHIGTEPVRGCIACGVCRTKGECVFNDDKVNECAKLVEKSDGIIFGSPVHYAAPAGALCAFLDRLFYSCKKFSFKVGASVVSARRAGTTAALDVLNKYFTISNMPVVGSVYWNLVHGSQVEDVAKDGEGLQTMRQLARNMAWLLKSIEAGKKQGLVLPEQEQKIRTNFIR